jgi:hypothetical protein
VQAKLHAHDLGDLSLSEAERFGVLIKRLSRVLKMTTGAAWTYCYLFMEPVRHVHVFLTTRYPNVPKEYVRLNIGDWPNAPLGGMVEIAALSSKIRLELE